MPDAPCKQKCDELTMESPRALYVHVPFCRAKCRYCDFYSKPLDGASARLYVDAAVRQLTSLTANSALTVPLQSVFLGGGTPTALGRDLLDLILAALAPLIDSRTEFSVEANPGAFDADLCQILLARGVNRLNFGVQSFQDGELAVLGRIHSARQADECIRLARATGMTSIGLDLIYAIPGQTAHTWRDSLLRAFDLGVDHLSCYALSFEPGTPLDADRQAGKITEVDEGLQRELYYLTIEQTAAAGLEHYEISNFARPGRRCVHNLTYWNNLPYAAVGPAAASYIGGVRRTNSPDVAAWASAVLAGQDPPHEQESLPHRLRMAETLMLGLRMIAGIDCGAFAARFGEDPRTAFPESIGRYLQQGAIVMDGTHLRLAQWALFGADTVLADIVAEGIAEGD